MSLPRTKTQYVLRYPETHVTARRDWAAFTVSVLSSACTVASYSNTLSGGSDHTATVNDWDSQPQTRRNLCFTSSRSARSLRIHRARSQLISQLFEGDGAFVQVRHAYRQCANDLTRSRAADLVCSSRPLDAPCVYRCRVSSAVRCEFPSVWQHRGRPAKAMGTRYATRHIHHPQNVRLRIIPKWTSCALRYSDQWIGSPSAARIRCYDMANDELDSLIPPPASCRDFRTGTPELTTDP